MATEGLWLFWSESRGAWFPQCVLTERYASVRVRELRQYSLGGASDWRAVRIPPPSQFEATAELLAALKLVRCPLELEEAIREYESNVAHAAIAKANGESA